MRTSALIALTLPLAAAVAAHGQTWKEVIRKLEAAGFVEKRRSFKRGLWGTCVATLMPHKAILLSRRDAAPPASFHLNVAKDRF